MASMPMNPKLPSVAMIVLRRTAHQSLPPMLSQWSIALSSMTQRSHPPHTSIPSISPCERVTTLSRMMRSVAWSPPKIPPRPVLSTRQPMT